MGCMKLGLGAGPLGDRSIENGEAERLIRTALDLGIRVVDTAPSYGASEERLGRVLADVRDRVYVVTKGGYGVPGVEDWTPEVIERGIDQALGRLRTDRIDAFILHSCPLERLARGDLLAPLERARQKGKVLAIGYSGDGDALAWAVRCEVFDVVECSVNLVDQEALAASIPKASARGMMVLAKRALAGAPWADPKSAYVDRWCTAFATRIDGIDDDELALRFAAHAPGVSTALFGTRRLDRLRRALTCVARGPLPSGIVTEIARRFAQHGAHWRGVI